MGVSRKQFGATDRAFFKAFDHWQPAARLPNVFADFLSPDEIRFKVRAHRGLLQKALRDARNPIDVNEDWDQQVFKIFNKLQSACLVHLFTRDPRAIQPAIEAFEALERCQRRYWTFSSCIGVLDMDLRTAEVAMELSMMKGCFGDALPADVRRRLARLIVTRCLRPGLEAERNKTYPWMHSRANWRIILCGCFGIGGMTFADEFPEYRELMEYGIEAMLTCFGTGDKAGGWNEGPGYWDYGLGYAVAFSRCLKLYTGGEVDLFRHPFLRKTGDFRLFMQPRPGTIWNWSDAGKQVGSSLTLTGLARAYQDPVYQWLALAHGMKTVSQLYAYDPMLKPEPPAPAPARRHFPGLGVVVWREGFGPRDAYVGVKAGNIPHFNHHCHMDFGNVVIHAAGRELLAELEHWAYPYEGKKDPKVKGYQPGFYDMENRRWMRWDLDNVAAVSHNIVTLEGLYPQAAIGLKARVLETRSGPRHDIAIVDSTSAYRPLATRVRRTVVYLRPDVVLLVDEIHARKPVRARVQFHPAAGLTWGGDGFTFTNGPACLQGTVVYPKQADQRVLGLEERKTSYRPPAGPVEQGNRTVYVENLWRKPRLVFITALQFGRKGFRPGAWALKGAPATDDRFAVEIRRGRRLTRVRFNLAERKVQVTIR